MDLSIKYKLDIEGIKESFKFTGNGLTHSHGHQFKLLPYVANEKHLVSEFSGVVGSFSRIISDKKLTKEFNVDDFLQEVSEQIGEYEGEFSEDKFKDIIKTMFIDHGRLIEFDINTMNYITSTTTDEKIANFLYSILFDHSLKAEVKKQYSKEIDNILYQLVLKSLPELKDEVTSVGGYNCYLPYVKDLFIKDFKFILSSDDLYKTSLKRFLEYYYLFYVSQLIMKLNQFEKADLTKPSKLYYTLDWERTSKTRTAYQFGWEKLKGSTNTLFSHAITLEMLNHIEAEKQLGYHELATLLSSDSSNDLVQSIKELIELYQGNINIDWDKFKFTNQETENSNVTVIYELFNSIKYQFDYSSRARANEAYNKWFVKFVQTNFGKRRGQLGYNLNITEEDIILLTKICINHNDKIKLNSLFKEFEARGLFFDRGSQLKIIELYEKLNLLEKKSDSGDAQYVKSVL